MPAPAAIRRLRRPGPAPAAVPLRHRVRTGALATLLVAVLVAALGAGTAAFGLTRGQDRALDRAAGELARGAAADRARGRADAAALAIATELDRLKSTAALWAVDPALVNGARVTADTARAGGLAGLDPAEIERRRPATSSLAADAGAQRFLDAAVQGTPGIAEMSFTDADGITGGAAGSADDLVQSDEPWWREAWGYGRWIGSPVAAAEGGGPLLPMAFRIDGIDGIDVGSTGQVGAGTVGAGSEPVGVLRVAVDLSVVRAVADRLATDGLAISVATPDGTLIAETATGHDPGRIGQPGLAPATSVPGLAAALPGGAGALVAGATAYGGAPLTAPGPGQAAWAVVVAAPVDLSATSSGPLAVLDRRLDDERRRAAGVLAAAAAAAIAAGWAAARLTGGRVAAPVEALAAAARELATHELPAAIGTVRATAAPGAARASTATAAPGGPPASASTAPAAAVAGPARRLLVARGWGQEVSVLAAALDAVARRAVAEAADGGLRSDRAAALMADVAHRQQEQARRQLELVDELAGAAGPAHTRLLHQLAHQVRSGRRQAESLLVLSGAAEPATRTAPVAVERVVAAALSEIDSPQRIAAGELAPAAVAGSAAADLAHLLSELVANGLDASRPAGPVAVEGGWQPGAYVLTVADTGPDLAPEELAALNRLVVAPAGAHAGGADLVGQSPASTPLTLILGAAPGIPVIAGGAGVDPTGGRTPLGLAVVRHLARQHGLLVRFRARAAGGLQAEVSLPRGLALPPPEPTTVTRRASDRPLGLRGSSRSSAGA